MNKENTEKLFERFSMFHPERPITESLMAFGFECDSGWFNLIWNLCEDLELIGKKEKIDIEVVQVKEKFGGLRFYINHGSDAIYERINIAETLSYKTCEKCGMPGKSNEERWVQTLCENCKNT